MNSPNAIILRSFTKVFSIPGVRVGYAVGHESVIEHVREQVPSWSITNVACEVIKLALQYLDCIPEWRERINQLKSDLIIDLKDLGFLPFPSAANFIFVKINGQDARNLGRKLLDKGLYVRTFEEFDEYIASNFFQSCS